MNKAALRRGSHRSLPVLRALGPLLLLLVPACAPAKAPPAEARRIEELLGLRAGMHVADVGAGDGEYTEELAMKVGPGGVVYSTEVDEDDLDDIRDRMEDSRLENVRLLLGDQQDTALPENCCDGILLRLVYHHFTDPAAMRASLQRALRPGGTLLAVEIVPQKYWPDLDGVPDRGGHGIEMEDLIREMGVDGWEAVARIEDWDDEEDHYCVVFRHPGKGS